MFANNKKVHLSALLLIWTCLMHANISIALKERWFTKQYYPGFLLSLKHCFKNTGITKLHTARSFQTTSRISFITPTVMVASSQRTQAERHVTTGFEMTWIKCDSLIQGHLKLFQASCRVKTDSNGPHMAEVSFDWGQTTQKLGKVHVNEPPAVSHHNSTIRDQEKTFVVRMKPLCL